MVKKMAVKKVFLTAIFLTTAFQPAARINHSERT